MNSGGVVCRRARREVRRDAGVVVCMRGGMEMGWFAKEKGWFEGGVHGLQERRDG